LVDVFFFVSVTHMWHDRTSWRNHIQSLAHLTNSRTKIKMLLQPANGQKRVLTYRCSAQPLTFCAVHSTTLGSVAGRLPKQPFHLLLFSDQWNFLGVFPSAISCQPFQLCSAA